MQFYKNILSCIILSALISSCTSPFPVGTVSMKVSSNDRQKLEEFLEGFLVDNGYRTSSTFYERGKYPRLYYHAESIGHSFNFQKKKSYPCIRVDSGDVMRILFIGDYGKSEAPYAVNLREKMESAIRERFKNIHFEYKLIIEKSHFLDP